MVKKTSSTKNNAQTKSRNVAIPPDVLSALLKRNEVSIDGIGRVRGFQSYIRRTVLRGDK